MSRLYQKLFAKYYDKMMSVFEEEMADTRRNLIGGLKGTVLGVGEGTGVNFQYYHPEAQVTCVEPSAPMVEIAKSKASKLGGININFINKSIHDVEFEPQSLDAVVCTLVLCTIPQPQLALENFRKWLKPEGKLIIMEHIHASKPFNRAFQNAFNPVWRIFSEGCDLNRDTDKIIKEAGFQPIEHSYFKRTLRFYVGTFIPTIKDTQLL